MNRDRLLSTVPYLALLGVGLLLWCLLVWIYEPPPPAPVTPTPTLVVVVVDPTPRAVERPKAPTRTVTAVPERLLTTPTRTRVPTVIPSDTPTPAPPTATPDLSKRVERG